MQDTIVTANKNDKDQISSFIINANYGQKEQADLRKP